MPSGKKRKGHKMATHKRKKRLRKNRHKKKKYPFYFLICNKTKKGQSPDAFKRLSFAFLASPCYPQVTLKTFP